MRATPDTPTHAHPKHTHTPHTQYTRTHIHIYIYIYTHKYTRKRTHTHTTHQPHHTPHTTHHTPHHTPHTTPPHRTTQHTTPHHTTPHLKPTFRRCNECAREFRDGICKKRAKPWRGTCGRARVRDMHSIHDRISRHTTPHHTHTTPKPLHTTPQTPHHTTPHHTIPNPLDTTPQTPRVEKRYVRTYVRRLSPDVRTYVCVDRKYECDVGRPGKQHKLSPTVCMHGNKAWKGWQEAQGESAGRQRGETWNCL